jgi:DNA-binding GntR family transcriptional regulator
MVSDNSQIRAALEPLAAQLAARAITDEQLALLRRLNDTMAALPEGDERYGALNREFHFTIYESAASPMLLSMMRLLWQSMPHGPAVTRSHATSVDQHAALIEALAARDPERTAEITRSHILDTDYVESDGTDA